MRVLIFANEFPPGPGGIGTHAFQLAYHLAQSQWQVSALVKQDYASQEEIQAFNQYQAFQIDHWPCASNKLQQTILRWQKLAKKLKEFQPDIVLASGESAVWLTALISILPTFRKTRWAAVWHGLVPAQPVLRTLSRWAYQKAQVVIAVSHYGLDQLNRMGVRPQFSQVIHNGADPEHFHPLPANDASEFRKRHSPREAKILLTVGHVSQRKGQEIVIRALPQILQQDPQVQYWMAGLPTQQGELEDLATLLGVSAHIQFLGKLTLADLRAAYNACDLFIMTSRHSQDGQFEGFGIAAVEAALCEKAAVVSDNSGLAEAILPGETGLVVQENNADTTAHAVLQLLEDEPLRKKMGQKARQRALTEQTWAMRVQQYDDLLRQLAQNSHDLKTTVL